MDELIDTHCHLDEDSFEPDRDETIARAVEAGVTRMLTIGTTAASSRRAVELAAQSPHLWAAVGIQPNYVYEAHPGDWDTIVELAGAPRVLAIGETGLDRYWDRAPIELQRDYFRKHIDLARERDLPFIVHCREAEADTLEVLREFAAAGPLRGVMHSFTGSLATAQECVELGMHISFAGMITFKSAQNLRDIIKVLPADRLLIETDSPYLAPSPLRGKRNEPANVRITAGCAAEVWGIPREELAELTTRNARELFRFPTV
jgi:TatD DNase family protein